VESLRKKYETLFVNEKKQKSVDVEEMEIDREAKKIVEYYESTII
jgi:hypothetical protein